MRDHSQFLRINALLMYSERETREIHDRMLVIYSESKEYSKVICLGTLAIQV